MHTQVAARRVILAFLVVSIALSTAAAAGATPFAVRPKPFGLMVAAPGLPISRQVQIAADMGVAYYRPSSALFANTWPSACAECDGAHQAGLALVLTVRANGAAGVPTTPPANLDDYRARIGKILARTAPAILAVENEESSTLFYSGTPQDYAAELGAACEVAHSYGVLCTNGGLVSSHVALLTWEDLLSGGDPTAACDFATRAFAGPGQPVSAAVLCQARSAADLPQRLRDFLAKGHALLSAYASAGADAVNFHWYILDAPALGQAAAFLRRATGLAPLSNETGQYDESAATPPALLGKALDLGLPCLVWFSIDTNVSRALINPDGSLRPNGQAFQSFVAGYAAPHAGSRPTLTR